MDRREVLECEHTHNDLPQVSNLPMSPSPSTHFHLWHFRRELAWCYMAPPADINESSVALLLRRTLMIILLLSDTLTGNCKYYCSPFPRTHASPCFAVSFWLHCVPWWLNDCDCCITILIPLPSPSLCCSCCFGHNVSSKFVLFCVWTLSLSRCWSALNRPAGSVSRFVHASS